MIESALNDTVEALAEQIAELADAHGVSIATAESLTGGQLAAALTAAKDSGDWFRGGIVAYQPAVKFSTLNVPEGPVVTAETATRMAESICTMMAADITVGVTGVGGPEPDEGCPAGTVYLATHETGSATEVAHFCFEGEPIDVMEQTIVAALRGILTKLRDITHA